MNHEIHDSPYSWLRLSLSLAIAAVGNVGTWAIIVVLPALQQEFGIGRAEAAVPYTLTMVGYAVGNLGMGRAVDRFGIVPTLWAAGLLLGATFTAAAMAGSFLWLSALHVVIGFGSAACFGPLIADISHWFMRRRGIAVAVAASGNYLSGAIWPLLLGGVLAEHGWRTAYLLIAALVTVTLLGLGLTLRRRLPLNATVAAEAQASRAAHASGLSPATLQWLLAAAGVACCVAMSMPQVHIVALCVDLGYGPAVGAEMLSLMLFGGVVSRLVSGLVADRLGGLRTLLIGSALQAIALCLYLPVSGPVSLYLVSLVFGLSQGGIVPSYALVVREFLPAREAGQRVGLVIMATILGMALGGWLSGVIFDVTGSYRLAFINGIIWNLINLAIVSLILFRTRPRVAIA